MNEKPARDGEALEDDPARAGSFPSADGTRLSYEVHMPEGRARACVLIVHGYGDHAGRYRALAGHLARGGFCVIAFDYRGHGRSDGQRGYCRRFGDYLSDLDAAWALTESLAGDLPLVLLAHSHGALIALHWLCLDGAAQPRVDAAVLSSPYLGRAFTLTWLETRGLDVCSRILPRLSFDSRIRAEQLTHDPELVAARKQDSLVHGVATARWFTESTLAQRQVADTIGRLSIPTLWLIGQADSIADPRVGLRMYERAGGRKSLKLYEGFYHELFNEIERERVVTDVTDWLEARYPTPGAAVPA